MPSIFGEQFQNALGVFGYINSDSLPIDFTNFNIINLYFPIILYCIDIGFTFISLCLVFGNTGMSIIAILVFGAGICSRIILGFIVTVFASGYRTQLIFMVMMITLTMMILNNEDKKFNKKVLNALIVIGILSCLNNMAIVLKF